jgi:hypothetical protein
MGFFYSLNAPVQARRRVSADVAWNPLLGEFLFGTFTLLAHAFDM